MAGRGLRRLRYEQGRLPAEALTSAFGTYHDQNVHASGRVSATRNRRVVEMDLSWKDVMNDNPDTPPTTAAEVLAAHISRLLRETPGGTEWELRTRGIRGRRLVMRHVASGTELIAESGTLDILALRHAVKQEITDKGGTIRKSMPRARAILAHAVKIGGPIAFAAVLGWLLTGAKLSTGTAFEVGAGATVLLAAHELGHVVTLRRQGIPASLPTFIPFLGALIVSEKIESRDAKTEAIVGIAGPIIGTAASYLTLGLYAITGWVPLVLMALVALSLNAFNMLPLAPLDGGRAAAAITPWLWPFGIAGLALYVWFNPGVVAGLLLGIGGLTAIIRLRRRHRSDYYRVSRLTRLVMLGVYLGTAVAIAGGIAVTLAVGGQAALSIVQ